MVGTMEIPTRYRLRVEGHAAKSSVQSQGTPREGSVFYETPTAYVRRINAENGIGAKVVSQPTNSIDDRVERELKVFERALNVLTGGRPAQERIKELREQEQAYVLLHEAYKGMKRLESTAAQLLIHAIQYSPV